MFRNAFAYITRKWSKSLLLNIITNEGNTTPRVAINPPMKPACDEPTKVAIDRKSVV